MQDAPTKGLTLQELQQMGAQPASQPTTPPQGGGLTLDQIKAKQAAPQTNADALNGFAMADQGSSSGIFTGPLSVLAAPAQAVSKVIANNAIAPSEQNIQSNVSSMQKIVDAFISKANNETDLAKKKQYIQQAQDVAKAMGHSSSLLTDLNTEALNKQKISTPIGDVPALSNDPAAATRQLVGRGITTTAFMAKELGPTASGALYGLGEGIESGKSAKDTAIQSGLYALGGKVLGYGLDKFAGTGIGQRLLTSPVGKAIQTGVEKLTTSAPAAGDTLGTAVSNGFKAFGDYADKALSPSTYLNPAKSALRPLGEATGVLRTPEQQVANSQEKIQNFWTDAQQRYKTAVRFGGDAPKTLAEEGIIPDSKGGAMVTSNQEEALRFKATAEHQTLNRLLDSTSEYASLENVRSQAISNINANFQGTDRQAALKYFNTEYEQFINDHASQIITRENGDRVIDLHPLNDFKSYLWSQGYPSKLAPKSEQIAATTARLTGNAMKSEIETAAQGISDPAQRKAVIDLNQRLGKLYNAANFLQNMNGNKLPFGLIGRHFARLTGAVVGASGGVAGSAVGALTADYLVDVLSNPKYTVGAAADIISKAQKEAPEALAQAQQIIERNFTEQANRLKLPEPSFVAGAGAPEAGSTPGYPNYNPPNLNPEKR